MNGQALTGPMLLDLFTSYVDSINAGSVPNIQHAWISICQNECQKALNEAEKLFELKLKEGYEKARPMFADDLASLGQDCLAEALSLLKSKSMGDSVEEYEVMLEKIADDTMARITASNEEECRMMTESFLQENFVEVTRKLREQKFSSFEEYEQEVVNFEQFCFDNCPPGPSRKEMILEFTSRAKSDAASYFINQKNAELKMKERMNEERAAKMEQDLTEMKQDMEKTRESSDS